MPGFRAEPLNRAAINAEITSSWTSIGEDQRAHRVGADTEFCERSVRENARHHHFHPVPIVELHVAGIGVVLVVAGHRALALKPKLQPKQPQIAARFRRSRRPRR
jgi:hypothetical protein